MPRVPRKSTVALTVANLVQPATIKMVSWGQGCSETMHGSMVAWKRYMKVQHWVKWYIMMQIRSNHLDSIKSARYIGTIITEKISSIRMPAAHRPPWTARKYSKNMKYVAIENKWLVVAIIFSNRCQVLNWLATMATMVETMILTYFYRRISLMMVRIMSRGCWMQRMTMTTSTTTTN